MLRVEKKGATSVATLLRDVRRHKENDEFSRALAALVIVGDVVLDLGGKRLHRDNRGPLVHLNRRVSDAGCKLVICNVHPDLMEKIETGGMKSLLVITEDEEMAHVQLAA
ncbi:MAG: hypothetical protein KDD66_14075 [Bdellovibrionales bacterium]|nr:hypothetical protein [Bdellovibrionales bacterium]